MSKRRYSTLWTHFEEQSDKKRAKCKYCSQLISIAGGSNGNLSRHMKLKHPFTPLSIERQPSPQLIPCEDDPGNSQDIPSTSTTQQPQPQSQITEYVRKQPPIRKVEQIDKQVLKMIAKGHHALRIVDEPEFQKLIEMVSHCPGYQIPTRKTVSNILLTQIYNNLLSKVMEKVHAAPALCLTTDGWTSRNNCSYIAITAHFLDASTKLCSVLIACKEYTERHTSENLCNLLKDTMAEWDISQKIAAVVSDNTANIITAVRLGEWRSIGCFAHLLNLIVQKAIKEISGTLAKAKAIVEYFNRSTQGLKKLKEMQKQMNIPELKLKQDVPTRWNSTYDMLARILAIKDAVISTIALLRSDLALDPQDWASIEDVLPILKPFYEVTKEISAEKNVTLSKVIVFCNLLKSFLENCSPKNDRALLSVLKNGMETRFRDLEHDMLYAECTILDPRFKQRGFENQQAFENALRGLRKKIGYVKLAENVEPQEQATVSTISCTADLRNEVSSIWDNYDQEIKRMTKSEDKLAAGIREVDKYLNEEYLDRKKDPLQWWEERRNIYPHLYAFILKRFCIVATSVPCERVFSATGQIINDRRTLLKPDKVSKLIFLHNNM